MGRGQSIRTPLGTVAMSPAIRPDAWRDGFLQEGKSRAGGRGRQAGVRDGLSSATQASRNPLAETATRGRGAAFLTVALSQGSVAVPLDGAKKLTYRGVGLGAVGQVVRKRSTWVVGGVPR